MPRRRNTFNASVCCRCRRLHAADSHLERMVTTALLLLALLLLLTLLLLLLLLLPPLLLLLILYNRPTAGVAVVKVGMG